MLAQDLDQIQSNAGLKFPFTDIGGLISALLPYIFGAAAIALLVYLVLGGFQLMTSRGDPKAIQGAQGKIANALIGFAVVVMSYAIIGLIGQVLGISQFSDIFGGILRFGGRGR